MTQELKRGAAYMVKHIDSQKSVRRIFKGTEMRFGDILCYVFSGKVSKKVTAEYDPVKNGKGEETGVVFWHWKGTWNVPNEISTPFYDLRKVEPTA